MNLFDLLKRKNAFDEYAKNMKPLQPVTGSTPNGQEPNVDLVQVDDTGNLAQNPTQVQQPVSTVEKMKTPRGQRLASFLFGTQAPATDSIDTNNDVVSATISESPRVGGVLPNLMNGFKENVNNGFNIENLTDNIGSDGRNKGLAYRIGEGLGTAARVLDSPFGRGLLTAGIVGGTGGSGLEALVYGGNSGVLNQNLRNNDRIYRNDLIANAKQQLLSNPEYNQLSEAEKAQILNNLAQEENYSKLNDEQKARLLSDRENEYLSDRRNQQLQDVENSINGLRGFVTNDIYKNLINSQQIRDNYAYRNMMLNNQQEQNKIMNALRQDQLKAQQQQQAFNQWYQKANLEDKRADRAERRAYQNAQLGLGYAKMNNDNYNKALDRAEKAKDREAKLLGKQENFSDVEKQLNNFKSTFKSLPSKAESYTLGNIRAFTGTQTTKETNFNAQRTLLFNQIARKLGGEKGVLSDQDMKRIELALPTLTDSYSQKMAKMQAIEDLLSIRKGGMPQTYTSGKYKVRVK